MLKLKSVLLSTSPSNNGTQFGINELEKALAQSAITSCLGHDSAKPAAWTVPFAIFS